MKALAIRHSSFATGILVLAFAAIVLYPTIYWPFDYDQGTFAYGGNAILHGARAYIDFWDIKPPNIFYTYAAAFALFGNSVRAVRIFDYLNALLSIALLFSLASRLWKYTSWGDLAAVLTSLAFLVQYYIFGHWDTAQTETYSIPLLLFAVMMVIPKRDTFSNKSLLARAAFAGVAIGISFYFKFPNALFLVLIAVALWIYSDRGVRFNAMGWLLAGFCVAVGLESFYLALNGELVPLWNLTISETANYVSSNYSGSFSVLHNLRTSFHALDILWMGAGVAGWVYWLVRKRLEVGGSHPELHPMFLSLSGCVIALLIVQLENKGYTYHYGILLPWADILIGAGIANLARLFARLDRMSFAVNAFFLVIFLFLGSYFWSSNNTLPPRMTELIQMAQRAQSNGYIAGDTIAHYVTIHSNPSDRIFIFGFQPYVYWKTGRQPATKFINTIHFKSSSVPMYERQELLHQLFGNPPELFLVEVGDRYTSQGNTNDDSRTTILLRYPALEQLLDNRYTPEDTLQQTIIYRLRHGPSR
jgi:4-amino-4-deoxy-L-arabinose transferase-like glycosyltransferase